MCQTKERKRAKDGICTRCGDSFQKSSKRVTDVCCPCFRAIRKEKARENNRRKCEICGKEFFRRPRQDDAARCCSRECGFILFAKQKRDGAFLPNVRASQRLGSLKPCDVCGWHFDSSGYRKHCCSRECDEVRAKYRYAGGYSAWANKSCADCGGPVGVVKSNKGKYCHKCRKARKKASVRVAKYGGFLKETGRTSANLAMVAALIRDAGNRCSYCGLMMSSGCDPNNDRHTEIDHSLPRSKGGGNEPGNLKVICRRCNHLKRDFIAPELVLVPRVDDISNSLTLHQV
jgi:hypothetical protein